MKDSFFQKVGSNSFKYVPGSIVPGIVGFLSVIILTRLMDSAVYGQYILALTTGNFVISLSAEWLKQSVVRYLPSLNIENHDSLFKEVVNFGLMIIVLALVCFYVFYLILCHSFGVSCNPMAFCVLFYSVVGVFYSIYCSVLQGEFKSGMYSLFQALSSIMKLVAVLLLLSFLPPTADLMVFSLTAGLVISLVPMYRVVGLRLIVFQSSVTIGGENRSIRELFAYGLPLVGWYVCAQILNVGDRFVIEYFLGSSEVGIYSANYSIVYGVTAMVSTPFLLAFSPAIMKSWDRQDKETTIFNLSKATTFYITMAVPFVCFWFFNAEWLTSLLLDRAFQSGYFLMGPVALGAAFWQLSMYGHKTFELSKNTTKMMLALVGCAVFNIVANWVFVPIYGNTAAAWTTFLSYFLYTLIIYMLSKRSVPWKISFPAVMIIISVTSISIMAAATVGSFLGKTWNSFLHSLMTTAVFLAIYGPGLFLFRPDKTILRLSNVEN